LSFFSRNLLPLYFALTLLAGLSIGLRLRPAAPGGHNALSTSSLGRLEQILGYIDYHYVDTLNTQRLLESLISEYLDRDEMVEELFARLDPHSSYMPASSLREETESLQGNFEGIGIEFNILRDTILVVSPISGGPSETLGIRSGDRIVAVEDSLVAGVGITEDQVRRLLRGPKGTQVRISVQRPGEAQLIAFDIKRDQIPLHSLDVAYMIDDRVGYVRLNRFSATTVDEFNGALDRLKGEGMQSLLLDLRGNPGGYLIAATRLADQLLGGRKLIVYTQGKSSPREDYYAKSPGRFEQGDLVVLIDEGSASASEIVAGALQDHRRAAIVGRRSFGKGLVQEIFQLPDSSAIRLTVARYYTPNGRCIQRPYDDGVEAYYEAYMERLSNGEEEDLPSDPQAPAPSAVEEDYGIAPDKVLPLDTSADRRAYYRLYNSGMIQRFAYDLYSRERAAVERFSDVRSFRDEYVLPEMEWDRFEAKAIEQGLLSDAEQRARIKPWIIIALQAQLARQAWKSEGFYPVYQQLDPEFQAAYGLLRDGSARALIP
jgi:carboxyl-terminal processing protease